MPICRHRPNDSVSCAIETAARKVRENVNNVFFIPIIMLRLQSY